METTMGQVVQKLNLTQKKNFACDWAEDTERWQFDAVLKAEDWAVNLKDLVFVDETGSNLAMTRRYARALKGTRAYNDSS